MRKIIILSLVLVCFTCAGFSQSIESKSKKESTNQSIEKNQKEEVPQTPNKKKNPVRPKNNIETPTVRYKKPEKEPINRNIYKPDQNSTNELSRVKTPDDDL